MIDLLGQFDVYSLLAACVIAIALAPTKFNIISTVLVAEFLLMIGFDALVIDRITSPEQSAYIFTIKLLIQTVFTLVWIYFRAWPLAVVSLFISGFFCISITAALTATDVLYYTEIMKIFTVSQIVALLMGVMCVLRINPGAFRRVVISDSSNGIEK